MLDRIIGFALKNRLLIAALALVVVIGGCFVATRMEVDVFPDLNAPTVAVMTEAPGMAPEEVEQLVTYPIETALNGTQGVRRIRSTSTAGYSIVWVEFNWDTDTYRARQNVSERLGTIREQFGKNVGAPVMGPQSSVLGEVMFIGLDSDSVSMMDLRTLADFTIAPRIRSLDGVAQVSVIGGQVKEYQILLRPERMREYNVTLSDVIASTEGINTNPAGTSVYDNGNEYLIRGIVSTNDAAAIGKSVVKDTGGMAVMLENVADVKPMPRMPYTGAASIHGKPGVIMTVTKQPDTGTLELTERIDAEMNKIKASLPAAVNINTDLYRQQKFIDSSMDNLKKSLIEGAVFVCIILFIFLMNPRTTLISLVTIPLSLLMTLLSLHFMGLTINTMSIGGIAIAIGSLVDDAIVDVENVYKRLRHNMALPPESRQSKIKVIYNASREVRMPILNSTLIIIVSFVPLFFLHGMEGRMLVPLGISFIIALVASTLVALTLTPVLCSWLLPGKGADKGEPRIVVWLKGYYAKALAWTLRHWRSVTGITAIFFVAALILFFLQGRSFLPPFNEGSLTINVSANPGISLEESERIGALAERLLMSVDEISAVARKTGRAELDEHALGINVSEIEAPFELKDRSKDEMLEEVREKLSHIPGVNIEIGQPISHRIDAMLSGTRANIAIKVFGPDLMKIHQTGKKIKEAIQDIPGLADVNVEQQVMRPQLKIKPRREVMAEYGITIPAFNEAVEVLLGGRKVSEVYENNQPVDLVVKLQDAGDMDLESIRETPITAADGRQITLDAIAEIEVSSGPGTVNRENIERLMVVSANVAGRDLRGAVNDIKETIDKNVTLPPNTRVEYGGQFESEERASRTLLLVSFFSILAIYLLLFNQFRNSLQSLVVMVNLPLALIGGVFAVALTSGVVSIPAIIGFISLFGIATRNGMLLVDRYNELIKHGYCLKDAIMEGSLDRLNPIIMTALTSALALIPLAAGGAQPGNEIQSPMAKVILGGLISSTLLNGFIIPIIYMLLNKNKARYKYETDCDK